MNELNGRLCRVTWWGNLFLEEWKGKVFPVSMRNMTKVIVLLLQAKTTFQTSVICWMRRLSKWKVDYRSHTGDLKYDLEIYCFQIFLLRKDWMDLKTNLKIMLVGTFCKITERVREEVEPKWLLHYIWKTYQAWFRCKLKKHFILWYENDSNLYSQHLYTAYHWEK